VTFRSVVILGAGAIGSAYGALLSRGSDVLLIGRSNHVEAIRVHGLRMEGDDAGTYILPAATKLEKISPETLLMVSTKAYDLAESLASVRHLVCNDTVILLLQNGLGIEEVAREALNGRGRVIRGLVTTAAEMLGPGRISHWRGEIMLGSDEESKKVAQLFESSGMAVRVVENFKEAVWRKLVMNCVINPLTAILRVRNNEIGAPSLKELRHAIVRECIAVGRAEDVSIGEDFLNFVDEVIPRYTNRSSMLQDIMRGRRTEIDFINGKIVELGRRHGIPTPVNETLTQLIHFMEGQHE